MIQELKIKNFLSFRDEVTLSFEATGERALQDYLVVRVAPGMRLLRLAIVYGANASGKTNLLEAFAFLREFWFTDKQNKGKATGAIPFLLREGNNQKPSEFELTFYVGSEKYVYELAVDQIKVVSEKLSYVKGKTSIWLFSRKQENGKSVISINHSAVDGISEAAEELLQVRCLPNVSFFVARSQVNCTLDRIDKAMNWMEAYFLPHIVPNTDLYSYATQKIRQDDDFKQYLLQAIKRADFNITGLSTRTEKRILPAPIEGILMASNKLSEQDKEEIRSTHSMMISESLYEHTVKDGQDTHKYIMPERLQSQGTLRTIGLEAAIYEAMTDNKFLNIDEIESSLHPDLLESVITQFLETQNQSQMICTTHYDLLLNTIGDLIRKDCVWFTEKGEDGCSSLYSLAEFKDLKKVHSFPRAYRNGAFGAIPDIMI